MYNMCHAGVYPLLLRGSDDAAVSVADTAGFTPTLLLLGSKLLLGRHFRYIFFLSINCPALAFFCLLLLLAAVFFPCDDDTAGSGTPVVDRFISSSKYRRLASASATLSRD